MTACPICCVVTDLISRPIHKMQKVSIDMSFFSFVLSVNFTFHTKAGGPIRAPV